MKTKWKQLAACIAIPLAVGAVASLLTGGCMSSFEIMKKPPLAPPGWLFPAVWTILYVLMGVASYLVLQSQKPWEQVQSALNVYALQLVFNFFWTLIFFGLGWYLFAFIWLITLWILILITLLCFFSINKFAGILLIPYLIWVTFAGYLNLGIALLN